MIMNFKETTKQNKRNNNNNNNNKKLYHKQHCKNEKNTVCNKQYSYSRVSNCNNIKKFNNKSVMNTKKNKRKQNCNKYYSNNNSCLPTQLNAPQQETIPSLRHLVTQSLFVTHNMATKPKQGYSN